MSEVVTPGRRRCVTFVAALISMVVGVMSLPSTVGADHTPAQVDDDRIELALIGQRVSIGPSGTLQFVYRVDGDLGLFQLEQDAAAVADTPDDTSGDDGEAPPAVEPPPLTIEVTNYAPLGRSTRLSTTQQLVGPDIPERTYRGLDDGALPIDGVQLVDVRSLFDVAGDGTTTLTIDVPTDVSESEAANLKLETPGLYPIRVQLKIGPPDEAVEIASHGTLVERLSTDPAISEANPIGLTVMSAIDPLGDDTDPAQPEQIDAQLDAAVELGDRLEVPITLSMPPATVGAAAARDADRANRLAESLDGDEVVADALRPLDVSSAVAIGESGLFARELAAGEDVLVDTVPLADVVRSAWIVLDPLSAAGAQELRDLGFRYLVMDTERYAQLIGSPVPDTDRFVEVDLPDGDTLPVLLVDPIADALSEEATEEILADRTSFEWAIATSTGWLLAASPSSIERTRLLSGPDLSPPDPTLIQALEVVAAETPSLQFVEGTRVPATTSTQRTGSLQLPAEAGPSLVERVQLLDGAALSILSTASMLADDDERRAEWTERIDALLSTDVTDAQAEADVESLRAELDAIKGSVVPPEPFTFTLTGRTGDIELQLGNRSDEPLDVVVRLSSPKVEFPEGDQRVTLRPNGETTLIVPLRALANGTSSVDVTVLTPEGEELATDITLTSRITAFTGMAQVLTGGFLLVLATWWIAHWRKKRREAAADTHRARHPSSGARPGFEQ